METQSEVHNRVVVEAARLIIGSVFDSGGTAEDVMVLTESVLLAIVLCFVDAGGEAIVLDHMVKRVKERAAVRGPFAAPAAGQA